MRIAILTFLSILSLSTIVFGQICDYEKSTVFFDLNACKSFSGLPSMNDYSEFTASIDTNANSSILSVVGGHLYRQNPELNPHSCSMGIDSTITMCIGALDTCDFVPNSDKALRFSIRVQPGPDGFGRLSTVSFYEAAKDSFGFINGASGVNDYPTLYGIRITKGTTEVYRKDSIVTSRDFALQKYDFSNNPDFKVTSTTIFNFELLPYCMVNNGGYVNAWDIENLLISAHDRDNTVGGDLVFKDGETTNEICVGADIVSTVDVLLSNNVGLNSDYIITTSDSIIIDSSYSFPSTITGTSDDDILIWHISYDSILFDNNIGNHINDILGCYTFSNPLLLIKNASPTVTLPVDFSVCGASSGDVTATISGGVQPYTVLWSNGDTSITIGNLLSGTYSVSVSDANGCKDSDEVTITVNPLPIISISGSNTICIEESTILTASGGVSYIWSDGQAGSSITVTPTTTTSYTVTATDANGCTNIASISVVVLPKPVVAIAGDLEICEGDNTELTASGGGTYAWSNGATTATILVSPTVNITYTVTVTNTSGCSNTASVEVIVNTGSSPTITGVNEICAGATTTLTAAGGTSYLWSNGATTASIDVTPITTTTYSVTATNANGCEGSVSYEVVVNSLPTVTITGDTVLCVDECTELTATGGLSYEWNTGSVANCQGSYFVGGPQYEARQKLYTYTGGALQEIGLLTEDNINGIGYYCQPSSEGRIYGMSRPGDDIVNAVKANFVSINPMTGETVNLGEMLQPPNPYGPTGVTGIINYIADVSDAGIYYFPAVSTQINPLTFEIIDYTIFIGKIDLNTIGSGINIDYQPLIIESSCTAYVDACITAFQAYALDPTIREPSGGIQDWALSSDNNTLYAFFGIENGIFEIDLTAMSGSCQAGPASNLAYTGMVGLQTDEFGGMYFEGETLYGWQVDRGRLFTIDKNTGELTLVDDGLPKDFKGDNATCNPCAGGNTSQGITVCPQETSTYTVTATDTNGCTNTASVTVTVTEKPIVTISGDLEVCEGGSTELTASGGGTYAWSNGATTAAIIVSPTVNTTYTVTVTNEAGCTSTGSVEVTVKSGLVPIITGVNEICAGATTTLTAAGGTSYLWSNGATTVSIDVTPIATTTYSVTATNANGCEGSVSYEVVVNSLPTVTITGDTELCVDECTELTATGGISYEWNTVNATNCEGSYFVGGPQYEARQKLYTYAGGALQEIGLLTEDNVNGIGYYCQPSSEGRIYGMSRPGDDIVNAVKANFVSINPVTGETVNLGELSQPPNIYGPTGITGIINYVADVSDAGIYYFPAVSTLINPATFEIIDYTIFIGKIDLNTIGSGINIDYQPLAIKSSCTAYVDACITAFQAYALDPTIREPSGGIQDWALSSDNNTLYAFFGIENGIFEIDLTDMSGSCKAGPASNLAYTGMVGLQTDEFGGMYFEGETLYGWQVDRGRLFTIDKNTGELTLVDDGLPKDFKGDNATCNPCAGGNTSQGITVCPQETSTYTVTATDTNGCTNTASVTVTVTEKPIVTISGDLEVCEGGSTELTAIGGGTYAWSNGATTAAILVSPTVNTTYTVTVTSDAGCIGIGTTEVVVNTGTIPTITGVNEICLGETSTLTAVGGTSFLWSNGETSASIDVSPIATTTYSVTATNDKGCEGSDSYEVVVNSLPTPGISGATTICFGDCTELTASGGMGYFWNTTTLNSTATVEVCPLTTTTYTVSVTNTEGCVNTQSVTVVVNSEIVLTLNGTNSTCGLGNGSASSSVVGGTSPYTYAWSNGGDISTNTGLAGGTYVITVTDGLGCTAIDSIQIEELGTFTTSINSVNTTCGLINGSATVTTTGGVSPFTYLWSNSAAEASVSNLQSGTYTVTTTDHLGCIQKDTIIIESSERPNATVDFENTTCGLSNGSATANPSQGVGPYTFLWSNGATTSTVLDLAAGTYSVTVTDAKSCTFTTAAVILGSNSISSIVSVEATTCGLSNGEATVSGTGGTAPYTYLWSNGDVTDTIVNLTFGTYTVTVTDNLGCKHINTAIIEESITPNGGEISGGPYDFCRDQSIDFVEDLTITNEVGDFERWVITDVNDVVVYMFNSLSDLKTFDFESTTGDFYSIYHISYQDGVVISIGDNVQTLIGCLDISNPITVLVSYYEGAITQSTALFDMDDCNSRLEDTSGFVYTEFIPTIDNSSECSTLSVVGEHFYRVNPYQNGHSCTPGYGVGGNAICVGSNQSCTYEPDSEAPIIIDLLIEPSADKITRLSSISFYEKAPDVYDWVSGPSGVNNWPTKFGVRIKKGTEVVFEQSDLNTQFDWNYREFILEGASFNIDTPTIFTVELMAYCPIGNFGTVSAWDIDDLTLTSECIEQFEAGVLTGGPYAICKEGVPDFITNISLTNAVGPNSKFVLVDSTNSIVGVYTTLSGFGTTNLDVLNVGNYKFYHMVYQDGLTGYEVGNTFKVDFVGCYTLSNAVNILSEFCGNRLVLYPNPSSDVVRIGTKGTSNSFNTLNIHNSIGQLIYTQRLEGDLSDLKFDFTEYGPGIYNVSLSFGRNMITKSVLIVR